MAEKRLSSGTPPSERVRFWPRTFFLYQPRSGMAADNCVLWKNRECARFVDGSAEVGEREVLRRRAGSSFCRAIRVFPKRRSTGGRVGGSPGTAALCPSDHDRDDTGRRGLPASAARA